MRRLTLVLGITFLAASALAHGPDMTVHNDEARFGDCSSNRVSFDGQRADIERQEIPAAGLRGLRVRNGNGAISVRGGNAWSIVACKAAEDAAALRAIDVRLSGNELSASGPRGDDSDWTVFYYITAPRGADLEVDATNGPVSLRDLSGTTTVRAKNGPLSLRNLSGRVDAQTANGPVSVTGGSGDMKISATNGPLSVKLEGNAWTGTLEASTQNGPLTVKLPRSYRSGVRVEAHGRGPVSCRAEGCGSDSRTRTRSEHWDDEPRTYTFGSGPQNVRLSTVNGPVSIKDAD